MKLSQSFVALATLALTGQLGSAVGHANLLTNGSFEDTTNFVDQGNDTDEFERRVHPDARMDRSRKP